MNTRLLARILPALTLCAWSGLLLYFYFSGRIVSYLTPPFRLACLLTGLALPLVALGLALAARGVVITPEEECEPATFGNAGGAGMRGTQWIAFLILTVPVYAAATYTQDSFSALTVLNRGFIEDASLLPRPDAAKRRSAPGATAPNVPNPPSTPPTASADPASPQPGHKPPPAAGPTAPKSAGRVVPEPALPGQPEDPANTKFDITTVFPKSADGALVANVVDLVFATASDSDRDSMAGQKFEIVGQILPDRGGSKVKYQLVRMFMYCCAADARPVALQVEAPGPLEGIAEMAWVKVTGVARFKQNTDGSYSANVQAERIVPTEPPAEVMVY